MSAVNSSASRCDHRSFTAEEHWRPASADRSALGVCPERSRGEADGQTAAGSRQRIGTAPHPSPAASRRIVRSPICDEGTFARIIRVIEGAEPCLKARGRYWRLVWREEGVSIYQEDPSPLAWLQERVEVYERHLYRQLLTGICGADGHLRRRTTDVVKGAGGGYRQRPSR